MKHLSSDGVLRDCNAQPGRCPLQHFESEAEAEAFLDERYGASESISKSHQRQIELPGPVMEATESLNKIGTPYVVGGAVRDSFFGSENKDIDIEVHGSDLDAITKQLRRDGYQVDEVGRSFGVLKVSGKGVRDLDVSVPRRENRLGAGHRGFGVEFGEMTTAEAAERRDFTLNAIMYDPKTGEVVDPANGTRDLKSGTLRHVSSKFSEDPLRVMRGFQMAGRFNMRYAPETAELCKSIRSEYSDLSRERVSEEWSKFYTKSVNPKAGVKALQESGWDDTEKGLKESLSRSDTQESLQRLTKAPKDARETLGLAVTTRSMSSDDRKAFLSKIATSKKTASEASMLVESESSDFSTDAKIRWAALRKGFSFSRVGQYGEVTSNSKLVASSKRARELGVENGPEKDLVNGNEIADAVGKKPGPWMKDAVHEGRRLQYSRSETTAAGILKALKAKF